MCVFGVKYFGKKKVKKNYNNEFYFVGVTGR